MLSPLTSLYVSKLYQELYPWFYFFTSYCSWCVLGINLRAEIFFLSSLKNPTPCLLLYIVSGEKPPVIHLFFTVYNISFSVYIYWFLFFSSQKFKNALLGAFYVLLIFVSLSILNLQLYNMIFGKFLNIFFSNILLCSFFVTPTTWILNYLILFHSCWIFVLFSWFCFSPLVFSLWFSFNIFFLSIFTLTGSYPSCIESIDEPGKGILHLLYQAFYL